MKNIKIWKRWKRFEFELNIYRKADPCDFKVGDEVICLFNNSGHKFWPELKEKLVIKKLRYYYPNRYWEMSFENTENHYFCEYDFKKVKKEIAVCLD